MNLFAIICTRETKLSATAVGLCNTLSSFKVHVKVIAKQNSIFEAYQKGLELCKADPTDIIIFCHDDIQITSTYPQFVAALVKCAEKKTGIVGPAGTTLLGEDAVWWNHERWAKGYHRGQVSHGQKVTIEKIHIDPTTRNHNEGLQIFMSNYGPHGQVVVLDGLFLAARKEVWEHVGLQKPKYFEGEWDFYDIHYTSKAHLLGYKNYTIPIDMIHKSGGAIEGRTSWLKNREAFAANTKLPLEI